MKKEKVNELFFGYHNLVPENRVTNLKSALERADDEKEESGCGIEEMDESYIGVYCKENLHMI